MKIHDTLGQNKCYQIGDPRWITCWITIKEDTCELELDHDMREWPNTIEMGLTREQAGQIGKILTEWSENKSPNPPDSPWATGGALCAKEAQ